MIRNPTQHTLTLVGLLALAGLPGTAACSGATATPPAPSNHAGQEPPRAASAPPVATNPLSPGRSPGGSPAASPPSSKKPAPFVRQTKPLTIPEARRYMLALINRDRASQGLPPVELDEGPATVAGQAHAEDMVRLGYLGHWGSDGSVPEQRYTDAGGADMVLENALCFTDEKKRTLDGQPRIDPAQIEKAESQFFDEVPPNDGHRRNILRPSHTRVGIGVAQPLATATELAVPCFTHEFVDAYGTYGSLPKRAKVGATLHVSGTLAANAEPTGVGVARAPLPKPLDPSELNKRRSYPVPKPFQMYWRPGFVTPIPVRIDGRNFSIDVPLTDRAQPGLYEISIWARLNGAKEDSMVSVRTILVE